MTKIDLLLEHLTKQGISAAVISDPVSIHYLTGFASDPHERYMFLFLTADNQPLLFLPALDVARAEAVLDFPAVYQMIEHCTMLLFSIVVLVKMHYSLMIVFALFWVNNLTH